MKNNVAIFDAQRLIGWYEQSLRSIFERTLSRQKLEEFDKDRDRLASALAIIDTEVAICFLGPSGIGKSTLINAIIGGSESVVPSGGIGPLTAQALIVKNEAPKKIEVEYHNATHVWRTVFALEHMFRESLGSNTIDEFVEIGSTELDEDELPEFSTASFDESDSDSADPSRTERREQFLRTARLLVTGSQDGERDLRYLLDSLREAAGHKRAWATQPNSIDDERMEGLRRAIATSRTKSVFTLHSSSNESEFRKNLLDHATGYLAPLIKNLTVNWPSPHLNSEMTLVDLPGIGIARDLHAAVTRKWIREKAHALVLVVDHRGMTESLAEALRRSEFLNTLLYSADDPDEDPVVMIAITRIDDLAHEAFRQDRSKKKYEHFDIAVASAKERLTRELQNRLHEIWLSNGDITDARKQVVENLLSTLEVHPVSAPEYARLIANDDDDRPFLRDIQESGIPAFIKSLQHIARIHDERVTKRLKTQTCLFHEVLINNVRLLTAQLQGKGAIEREAAQLRDDLEVFIQPLRIELANRQGGYRTFLKKTMPRRIKDLVAASKAKANRDIDRYLSKLWKSHWATLRASVRRGGRYSGASDINLPTEFALRFEEPIAETWGKEILKDVREETREYADVCVNLMEQVAEWALTQGARVDAKIIEAQRNSLRADAKKLQNVGREMVKEMRDEAKAHLIDAIEAPIKKECSAFVRKNLDVGPGVKMRILELYEQLSEKVTDVAEEPATKILLRLFKSVEKEILDAFAENQDPLSAICEAILSPEAGSLEDDSEARNAVLAELKLALIDAPELGCAGDRVAKVDV
jgi:GTP-binding protein EngB required for normal cell division